MPVASRYNHVYPDGIRALAKVDEHEFRPKKLCSSPSYQQAMAEAETAFQAEPNYSALEIKEARIRGENLPGVQVHGFFYQSPPEPATKIGRGEQGAAGRFALANKRFNHGWDAGKEQE